MAKPGRTHRSVVNVPLFPRIPSRPSARAAETLASPRGRPCGLRCVVLALALLQFTCLHAAVFMDPATGTTTNGVPTLVAGYPYARQAVGQRPPGIYEAAYPEGQPVFVRVAEDLATYAELLQRRKSGAALKTADELLAATVSPEVPAAELTGEGPSLSVHGFTAYGVSFESRLACPACHAGPCGASDPAAPRPGDDLCIHLSPSDVGAFITAVLWLHGHGDAVTQANINSYFGYSTTPNCPNGFNPRRVTPSLGPNAGKAPPGLSSGTGRPQFFSGPPPPSPAAAYRLAPPAAATEAPGAVGRPGNVQGGVTRRLPPGR